MRFGLWVFWGVPVSWGMAVVVWGFVVNFRFFSVRVGFSFGVCIFHFHCLFISGMVIMCVSDFFHFFGDRVFGWPFFGWACVFLLGFWKIHRFSPYEGGCSRGFQISSFLFWAIPNIWLIHAES